MSRARRADEKSDAERKRKGLLRALELVAPEEPVRIRGPIALKTERLILRAIGPGDRAEFAKLVVRNEVHLAGLLPIRVGGETVGEAFDRHLILSDQGEVTRRAMRRVVTDPSGAIVGGVNINDIAYGLTSTGELNWWVSVDHVGHGYATEAVSAMIEYAMRERPSGLGLDALDAMISPDNVRSEQLASRLGFRKPKEPLRVTIRVSGDWVAHDLWQRFAKVDSKVQTSSQKLNGLRAVIQVESRNYFDQLTRVKDADLRKAV